jgi:acyl-coenzyme A synthetase/AMP-(fatty) acid ligase
MFHVFLPPGILFHFLTEVFINLVNCVDRHYVKNPDKVALIWERDEVGTQEYISYKYFLEIIKVKNKNNLFVFLKKPIVQNDE